MKVLQSFRRQVKNISEGTTVRPSLVSVKQGKTKVYILTIKIGNMLYECVQHSNCNKWRTFRCKNNRKANAAGDKCSFKMKVKNISGVTVKENSEVFWRTKSWQILENETADHHCCTGIETEPASEMEIETEIEKSIISLGLLDGSWTEKRMNIRTGMKNRRDFTYQITEDLVVSIRNEKFSIEVDRRDQTILSLDHGVKWQMVKTKKDTVMAARRDGSLFFMKSWKVDGNLQVHQEVSFYSNLDPDIPLLKFDVNGDVVIIENVDGELELWSIRETVPKQISLPNLDFDEDCHWVVGEVEEFHVALASTDCYSPDCYEPYSYLPDHQPCRDFKFALVYNNFISQNFVYRITFPKKDHVTKVQLTEVDVGNNVFKTVLVAECRIQTPRHAWRTDRYYYHIYDLNNGKLIETLSNDGWQSVISGAYIFPNDTFCSSFKEDYLGVDISRINWNGSSWSISTHFIKFPNFTNTCWRVSITNVTDTRVTWNLSGASLLVCDY